MSQLRFRLANLLNKVAQWLVNPRAAIAQWEEEHPYEECDPFCFCLDCQAKWETEEVEEHDFLTCNITWCNHPDCNASY